ncbi:MULTISPECIES: GGDEF domain-containing protein [Hyphomicrobium]|uniref:GGDEF domain-containing protein n=1 Tax=Hyphomicrobium TaxID=81 RepID=UPI0003718920|nr:MULTISPECIES: GGDEF domain-containing protein [Hyphomicrobium]WBT39550.1 GGDEF domain-containing protein [Hyphomicrobium sp. DMF-1]
MRLAFYAPMISFLHSLPARHGIALAAALIGGVSLAALSVFWSSDLAHVFTLRTVLERGGAVTETRYNPIGILALSMLAVAGGSGVVMLGRLVMPLVSRKPRIDADRVASVSKTLGRELSNALAVMRGDIASREAYARALADAQVRLGRLPEAEQVRVIVSLLVAENQRMRRASSDDKNKLDACAREISSLEANLRAAEEATLKDPLTGMGNRRLFDEEIERAVGESNARRTPLSLIMCDIDHFKRVNDTFGHSVGDEIIKALTRIIASSVQETDSVARYGGEEFVIILPGTDQRAATAIAERIRRQFGAKQFSIRKTHEKVGRVTASFGVVEHRPGDDVEMFVQRADAKLYEAKARGRDRVADYSDHSTA